MGSIIGSIGVILVALSCSGLAWGEDTLPPENLENLHMAGTIQLENGGDYSTLSLHTCALKDEFIACSFVLTSHRAQAFDYRYGMSGIWSSKLVDQFKVDHPQVRGYFLNGRGQHENVITLTHNDWTWVVQEFSGAATDITSASLIFPGGKYFDTTVEGGIPAHSQ